MTLELEEGSSMTDGVLAQGNRIMRSIPVQDKIVLQKSQESTGYGALLAGESISNVQ